MMEGWDEAAVVKLSTIGLPMDAIGIGRPARAAIGIALHAGDDEDAEPLEEDAQVV